MLHKINGSCVTFILFYFMSDAAIGRYLLLAGPAAANLQQQSAAGEWDRQTDTQTDGHGTVSFTLLRVLWEQYQ